MVLKFTDLLHKKVLIVGEAGSGKTSLLAKILEDAVNLNFSNDITVIEMSPGRIGNIGGRLVDFTESVSKVKLLMPDIVYAPRLMGKNKDEVLVLAKRNKETIEKLLNDFLMEPSKILFINDLTIYLHAGDTSILERCIDISKTFVGTAYYGRMLDDDKGSGITQREKESLKKIMRKVDTLLVL